MITGQNLVLFHTAHSNIAVFEDAAHAAGILARLQHVVRADLLQRAQDAGTLTPELAAEAMAAMAEIAADGTQLLCTCSTIGAAADRLAASGKSVTRADRALAHAALAAGGNVAVIVAAPSTTGPTGQLFAQVGGAVGNASFSIHMAAGAWAHFQRGDLSSYYEAIGSNILRLQDQCSAIALAQVSMAPVAHLEAWRVPILAVPNCALTAMYKAPQTTEFR